MFQTSNTSFVFIMKWSFLTQSWQFLRTVSVPQKQPAEGGIYAVRLLILMLKKTFKKAHDGKGAACRAVDGKGLLNSPTWVWTLTGNTHHIVLKKCVFALHVLLLIVFVSCRVWLLTVLISMRPSKWIKSQLSNDESRCGEERMLSTDA